PGCTTYALPSNVPSPAPAGRSSGPVPQHRPALTFPSSATLGAGLRLQLLGPLQRALAVLVALRGDALGGLLVAGEVVARLRVEHVHQQRVEEEPGTLALADLG